MGGRRNVMIAHADPGGLPPPIRQEAVWRRVARIEALTAQRGRCAYCREPLPARDATADHVVAQIKGGRTSRDNIKAACQPCNAAKGSMPIDKFKRLLRSNAEHSSLAILIARFRFRLWSREETAEKRILGMVGMEP